jgi:hypothetical protein
MIPKKPAPAKAGVADFSDKIMRKNQRMIPKMPAPAKAGVADFSDKITRKI